MANGMYPVPSDVTVDELSSPDASLSGSSVKATVIVPLHDRLDMTRACVASLLEHATEGMEVILVDNASSDGTAEWCEKVRDRVRVLRVSRNIDFAGACNLGASEARGTNIVFLNNDTVVTSGWLDALIRPLGEPEIGIVGARLLYPDGTIQHCGVAYGADRIGFHVNAGAAGDDPAAMVPRLMQSVTGACLAVRRSWFMKVMFDTGYRNGCEDLELCLRAIGDGLGVWYEPSCVVYHHESQSVGRFDHAAHNLRRFLDRWVGVIVPDVSTFQPAPKVADAVQRYPYEGGPWPGMHAIPGFADGDSQRADVILAGASTFDVDRVSGAWHGSSVLVHRVAGETGRADRINEVLAATSGSWVVVATGQADDQQVCRALAAAEEVDLLTALPTVLVQVRSSRIDDRSTVLALSRRILDDVGGLDPDRGNLCCQLDDLVHRLELHGHRCRVVGGDDAVALSPSHGAGAAPKQLYVPLSGRAGDASHADFPTRTHGILIACDDATWPGYRAAVRGVLEQVTQQDDVTVVVRAVDLAAACAVLEAEAARIDDDDLADVVLVAGDSSLDPALCDLVDVVVVDAVPSLALHGCARHHQARCVDAARVASIRTLLGLDICDDGWAQAA